MRAIINLGFTGTRKGMTPAQHATAVRVVIAAHEASASRGLWVYGHHGDCLGADAEFHAIVRPLSFSWLVGHIPENQSDRAFCTFDEVRAPLPYMKRNREIVRAADVMIAAPPTMEELEYGGTWRTIGLARKAQKRLAICFPDGSVKWEFEGLS